MVVIVSVSLIPLGLVAAYAIANFRPLWLLAVFGLAGSVVLLSRIQWAALALPVVIFLPNIGKDIPGPFALFLHDLYILGLFGLYASRQIARGERIVKLDRRAFLWLSAFVLLAGVSLIKAAMLERWIFMTGLKDWIRLVELGLMTVTLAGIMDTAKTTQRMLKVTLAAGSAALAVAFWAYIADSDAFYGLMNLKRSTVQLGDLHYRMISTMGSAAHTGVAFATLAALATVLLRREYGVWVIGLGAALIAASLGCVLLTYTKGTWVAFPLALLVLWASGRLPRIWLYAVGGLLIVGAVTLVMFWPSELDPGVVVTDFFRVSRSSAEVRLDRWASVQNVLLRDPLIGVGYNVFAYVYGRYAIDPSVPFDYGHPHNMYVDVLTGTGIAGLVAFLGLLGRVLGIARGLGRKAGLSARSAALGRACYLALLVFLGASLFNSFTFKAGRAAMLLFLVISIILALDRQRSGVEDGGAGYGVGQERELEGPVGQ